MQMRPIRKVSRAALVFILAGALSPLLQGAPQKPLSWEEFVQEHLDGYFRHRPDLAVSAGRHEFDGRLPDWSPEGLGLLLHFLKEQRAEAVKFGALNRAQEFERGYLIAHLDSELFWLEVAELPFTNPTYYTSFQGLDPNVYVTRAYAPLEERMRAFTRYLQNVPKAVEQIRRNLRMPMPRTVIEVGRTGFGGLANFFQTDVLKVFASVPDPALQWEFSEANTAAIEALNQLDQWLESELPRATTAFAIGPRKFQQMLWATERVNVPLTELDRIGRKDLERNLSALQAACQKVAPG